MKNFEDEKWIMDLEDSFNEVFDMGENLESNISNIDNINGREYEVTKKATIFETGGKRPTNELLESWIGRVGWKNEEDKELFFNEKFIPLVMLFIEKLPFVPECISDIKLINVFMSKEIWDDVVGDITKYFIIRTYKNLDNLVQCDYKSNSIKPFPLFPKLVEDDTPMDDLEGEKYFNHKVGGYETFCQEPMHIEEGYEFVFQITSDEKAGLNIVDNGNFYFYYNRAKNEWKVKYDFY